MLFGLSAWYSNADGSVLSCMRILLELPRRFVDMSHFGNNNASGLFLC